MYDFTESIMHSYVGEAILYGLLLLLILAIIIWLFVSIYYAVKSNKRFEPMKQRDKNEFYFLIRSALYKAVKAYESDEPLGDSPTKLKLPPPPPPKPKKEKEEKKAKARDKGGIGFRKKPRAKR